MTGDLATSASSCSSREPGRTLSVSGAQTAPTEPSPTRVFEEPQLRLGRVREHRLGAEREARFHESGAQPLGFGERAAIDSVCGSVRLGGPKNACDAIRVDVGQRERFEIRLEERGLPGAIRPGEEYQNGPMLQRRPQRRQRTDAHFRRATDFPRAVGFWEAGTN